MNIDMPSWSDIYKIGYLTANGWTVSYRYLEDGYDLTNSDVWSKKGHDKRVECYDGSVNIINEFSLEDAYWRQQEEDKK